MPICYSHNLPFLGGIVKLRYFISLFYSLFGSLGLLCFLDWFAMAAFHERHHYPYRYPFSVMTGLLSLLLCFATFAVNIILLSDFKTKRVKTVTIEVLLTIITFVPCFIIREHLLSIVGALF